MVVNKKYFPKIMTDNDAVYMAQLEGVVGSVDELCSMEITKTAIAYKFRIAPSHPKYINMLVSEIVKFHNLFGIRLNMSKSMKSSSTIVFEIDTTK